MQSVVLWEVLVYEAEETFADIGFDALIIRRVEPADVPGPFPSFGPGCVVGFLIFDALFVATGF